jgi:hypothetical protein
LLRRPPAVGREIAMRETFRSTSLAWLGQALVLALIGVTSDVASSQTCTPEQVFKVIDETGARLRQLNGELQPRIGAKLGEIAKARGWKSDEIEARGRTLVDDAETRRLDARAATLLSTLDRLGDDSRSKEPACERLEKARAAGRQLVEVTSARSSHISAKLEAALHPAPAPPVRPPLAAASPPAPPGKADAGRTATAAPTPKPAPPSAATWGAETVPSVKPDPAAMSSLPRHVEPGDLGFTPAEILAAGRGLFGSISAGLASVINYAFQNYGRPTGYILGGEGGGAFFAGLRYGEGRLVTKIQGERKIYWQGPSVGFDFGLEGSRVMFLVYNLDDHEQVFARFAGVDGSAYLVGGAGITFLKKGKVVLAPIRTGLGVRVGANLGYVKFTPSPSLNPF